LIAPNRGVELIRINGNQDVARFEIGLRYVQDDAGTPLDGLGGNGLSAGYELNASLRRRMSWSSLLHHFR